MLTAEPKAYGSNWYAATRVESPARPRLTVELDVDVCVIGAGLAGLTVAREVARLGWSVVVLEAKSVAWSASGRNTGVVLPGFSRRRRRADRARRPRSSQGAVGAFRRGRRICAQRRPRHAGHGALRNRLAACVENRRHPRAMAHEAALMAGEFGAAVEPWPADRVREALQSPRYFHGLHYPQRLLPASAQLCARSRRRGGSRRRPHLRGYAGAGDRSGGRAEARHHPAFARPRGACGARRQRAYDGAGAAVRQHAVADLQHVNRHRAAGRRSWHEAIRFPGAVSDERSGRASPSRRGWRPSDVVRPKLASGSASRNAMPMRSFARSGAPIRRSATSRPSMPGSASPATRCMACRRSARSRRVSGC